MAAGVKEKRPPAPSARHAHVRARVDSGACGEPRAEPGMLASARFLWPHSCRRITVSGHWACCMRDNARGTDVAALQNSTEHICKVTRTSQPPLRDLNGANSQIAGLAKLLAQDAAEGDAARRRVLLLDLRGEDCFAACHINGGARAWPSIITYLPILSCFNISYRFPRQDGHMQSVSSCCTCTSNSGIIPDGLQRNFVSGKSLPQGISKSGCLHSCTGRSHDWRTVAHGSELLPGAAPVACNPPLLGRAARVRKRARLRHHPLRRGRAGNALRSLTLVPVHQIAHRAAAP